MTHPLDLIGFLGLGLLGGFGHCVGMCSPFVMFISRRFAHPAGSHHPLAAHLWYGSGRISTYAALGAAAGALGGIVELGGALLGIQRAAALLAGAALVVWALAVLTDVAPPSGGAIITNRFTARFWRRVPGHPYVVGLTLGLLPCGLLYSAVVAAVARGSAVQGMAALLLFGAGTMPALLGVFYADELLARRRAALNWISQVFVLGMGLWFLWRGFAM
ncbi:MAG: sulfite exporter TauE/SafE family protein [Vicinamibacterales bacterium]